MTPSTIISECAREFWLHPSEVTGRLRKPDICDARHIAMWIMHRMFRIQSERVARHFRRERSSVSHAVHRVDQLKDIDPRFAEAFRRIMQRVGGV